MTDSGSRFRTTVPFYARFRPRYPDELNVQVAARCHLNGSGRLLDLGCGPGFIAIAMARYFAEVVGVDPEPLMLEAARHEAEAAGVAVNLILGSSATIGAHLGKFRMAAMGRSFHWMDRDATLVTLDSMIDRGGAIALFGEHLIDAPENGWRRGWEIVARKWADGAHRRHWRNPDWERHDTVLARSAFNRIERITFRYRRTSTIDELVGRAYSMSSTSPAVIGDRKDEFERELKSALTDISPSGTFDELVEAEAMLAWRPSEMPPD